MTLTEYVSRRESARTPPDRLRLIADALEFVKGANPGSEGRSVGEWVAVTLLAFTHLEQEAQALRQAREAAK